MYFLTKGLVIIIGSIFISLGINLFLTPYEILDGGIVGLALILHYLYNLKIGLMIIILSMPIFIIAWFKYRAYFFNSLHGLIISSLLIDLLKPIRSFIHIDAIYSSIFGGIFIGCGIGLMLRFKTSTGGTDLIAQFLSDKTGINVGILIFIIDSSVILLGGLLLSTRTLLLSIIMILVVSITTSLIMKEKVSG
ncbi:YitT family protein [Solibacillus sp. CAU 1738]|uniref:YitT family protein n=1 Tax=Solibacillus sp. CAU 1738 TaxID=3140363 RepID=UPI0032602AC3